MQYFFRTRLFIASILGIVPTVLSAQTCTSTRFLQPVFSNVTKTSQIYFGKARPYGSFLDQELYLDIYEPTGDTLAFRPVIIYAYGGGFLVGDKNQPPIPTYCEYFAKHGYVVVSVDYRKGFNTLDPGSPIRAVYRAAQDLRAAIRHLCQRATQYKIDTAAIFLTGSSAGCFSALHQTFFEEFQRPAETYGTLLEPDDLGCFDCAVNTDFHQRVPQVRGIINHWGAIIDTALIEGNRAKDRVPVISFHGDGDNAVPFNTGYPFSYPIFPTVHGSNPLHRRLRSQGIKNKLVTLVGSGHEPWLLDGSLLDTAFKHTLPFLYEILKPAMPVIMGDSVLCAASVGTYTVANNVGSKYCFSLSSGGTIVAHNANSITIRFTQIGNHILRVRELTKNQVNSEEATYNIRVEAQPVAFFSDSVLHTYVSFSDSSQHTTAWLWNFGDGNYSTRQHPTHHYNSAGLFTVQLIASNGYCSDTFVRTIETDTCPRLDFSYTVSGNTLTFSPNVASGDSVIWLFGDGTSSNDFTAEHTYAASQNYLVTLKIITGKNCQLQLSKIVNFQYNGSGVIDFRPVKVYPSPFTEKITISNEAEELTVKIFNAYGQLIYTGEASTREEIDTKGWSKGLYVVQVLASATLYSFSLAKIH